MAFEKVLSEAIIQGCVRKKSAWNIISDYSKYPAIMDNVDNVEIVEKTSEQGISKWQVSIDDAPLYWIEKDYFNHRNFEIAFKSFEGDFDNINGRWNITDSSNTGIKITFEIEYNLGIPVIEEVLGAILRGKMKSNMEKMVGAIKKELTSSAIDERRFPRAIINKCFTCRQNGVEHDLSIINLSAGGMMVRKPNQPINTGALQLSVAMLNIASVVTDESEDYCRITFQRPLEEEVFSQLKQSLISEGRAIETPCTLPHDAFLFRSEGDLPVQLLELTSEGMHLFSPGAKLPDFSAFSINPAGFPFKEIIRDEKTNTVRVIFNMPLSREQHQMVADHFKQIAA
jgi:ribosome-associated toxin RatA of RatAB toxin-antitoxin module